MMKFFRQYNKQLLAVFMALLLVVWLAGDALTYLMRSDTDFGKQVQGTAYGETVRLKDMLPSFQQTETLDQVFGVPIWQEPWVLVLSELKIDPRFYAREVRPTPMSREEWYMLNAAAQRANVHVPPEAVESYKARIGLTPDILAALRQRSRKTVEEIDQALRSFLRVREAATRAAQAVKVSEADVNDLIRQTGEKARITAVVLDTKSFIDNTYEPTPEEIQAQFDKYKNATSRPSEPGYQIPAAVQVEVIRVAATALAPNQKVDEQAAHVYWKEHQNEFMKPPATQPTTSTAPASQPMPYTTFSEAKPKVIAKLQKDRSEAEAQRIAREAIEKLQGSWASSTAPSAETAPASAPESEKAADLYEKLAGELEARYPGAVTHRRLDLMTEQQLRLDPVSNATALPNSQQQINAVNAAFMVPGLGLLSESVKSHPFYRALYQTATHPFVAPDGSAYVLRTIAVRPARAPESPEVVRAQIVQDLRQARAREETRKAAEALTAQAAQKGLEAAFTADEALKQKLGAEALKKPDPFAHKRLFTYFGPPRLMPEGIPALGLYGMGNPVELVDNLFTLAGKTATQPSRVTMAEDPFQKRYIVAELHEIMPVTRAEYEKQRAGSLQILEAQERVRALQQWFSPEQIRTRVSWQDALPPQPASEEGGSKS